MPVKPGRSGRGIVGNKRFRVCDLARDLLLHRERGGALHARRNALRSSPYSFDVNLQFRNGAAERVAVHSQLPGRPALVALVLLLKVWQPATIWRFDGENEAGEGYADHWRLAFPTGP